MHPFPHRYHTGATATPDSQVTLNAEGAPDIESAPPPEFGGPGGYWSPESLLTAAVADCFILTFKAISRASKLDWVHLECDVQGTLDRVDGVTRFTRFDLTARLAVPAGTDREKAERLLQKSEAACLVTASLKTENHLAVEIIEG